MLFVFCCTSQLNSGTDSEDFSRIFLVISGADIQPEDEDIWCFKLKHKQQRVRETSEKPQRSWEMRRVKTPERELSGRGGGGWDVVGEPTWRRRVMLSSCPWVSTQIQTSWQQRLVIIVLHNSRLSLLATLHGYCVFGRGVGGVNATKLAESWQRAFNFSRRTEEPGVENVMNPTGKLVHRPDQ